MKPLFPLVLLLLSLSSFVYAGGVHHDQSSPFTETVLNSRMTMLQGRGGNMLVHYGDDGILLIDDDFDFNGAKLIEKLASFGGGENLKFVINTHWHADHTGGNLSLSQYADFVAHKNVRVRMGSEQYNRFFKSVSKPQPAAALPNITFSDELTIHFNDDELLIKHLPNGHTDGDSVIYFKQANLLHTGDNLFNGIFPFVDLSSDGNAIHFANNLGRIIKLINDDTVVIPGHGGLMNRAQVKAYYLMVRDNIDEVTAMKSDGLTLEQAQTKGLNKQWSHMGKGLIKESDWIGFIYQSL